MWKYLDVVACARPANPVIALLSLLLCAGWWPADLAAEAFKRIVDEKCAPKKPATVGHNMSSILTPKRKEEFVLAVGSRCAVSYEELQTRTLDRLRELCALLRPPRKSGLVPSVWKDDIQSLCELYSSHVVETTRNPKRAN